MVVEEDEVESCEVGSEDDEEEEEEGRSVVVVRMNISCDIGRMPRMYRVLLRAVVVIFAERKDDMRERLAVEERVGCRLVWAGGSVVDRV